MIISIDRFSMKIAGKKVAEAFEILERFGFSFAESSEIITSNRQIGSGEVNSDWKTISETVRSTIECSVRLGDRIDMNIG